MELRDRVLFLEISRKFQKLRKIQQILVEKRNYFLGILMKNYGIFSSNFWVEKHRKKEKIEFRNEWHGMEWVRMFENDLEVMSEV